MIEKMIDYAREQFDGWDVAIVPTQVPQGVDHGFSVQLSSGEARHNGRTYPPLGPSVPVVDQEIVGVLRWDFDTGETQNIHIARQVAEAFWASFHLAGFPGSPQVDRMVCGEMGRAEIEEGNQRHVEYYMTWTNTIYVLPTVNIQIPRHGEQGQFDTITGGPTIPSFDGPRVTLPFNNFIIEFRYRI